ncbi:JAB domain-containing protein [Pedobacter ginsengisoli]|uniref:JAB domain-containing protein n=1 Tax=Pedobacter ginsengisoli TaxID=363852 RepID=UPI003D71DD77
MVSTKYSHPTEQDLSYTFKLVESASTLSIVTLDHIVTYPEGYYSFRDHDLLIL